MHFLFHAHVHSFYLSNTFMWESSSRFDDIQGEWCCQFVPLVGCEGGADWTGFPCDLMSKLVIM